MTELLDEVRIGLGINSPDFELRPVLDTYFRKRFEAEKCVGLSVSIEQIGPGDKESAFFALCQELAERLKTHYEFLPLRVALTGWKAKNLKGQTNHWPCLHAHYLTSQVFLTWLFGGTNVAVVYYYPAPHHELHNDLLIGGSSHSQQAEHFNMAEPNSTEMIWNAFRLKCERMLRESSKASVL